MTLSTAMRRKSEVERDSIQQFTILASIVMCENVVRRASFPSSIHVINKTYFPH